MTEVVTIAGAVTQDWINGDFTRHATPVNGYPAFCRDVGEDAPLWIVHENNYGGMWCFGASDAYKGTCASAVPPSAPGWSCSDSNYAYVVAHSFTPCGLRLSCSSNWNACANGATILLSCSIN